MVLSELIAISRLRLRLLTGAEHAGRRVRWVYTTDLPRPQRYLNGDELVLTGMMWRENPADSREFVRALCEAGVAALGAGTAIGEIPTDLVQACAEHDLPLVEVPSDVSFATVTEEALHLLTRDRADAATQHRGRHRHLMTELAAGAELPEVFGAATAEAGLRAWVVSSTGRLVAAGPDEETRRLGPDQEQRRLLARSALRGGSAQRSQSLPATDTAPERVVTLTPIRTRTAHPLTGWLLVCDGPCDEWSEAHREAAAELASLVMLARGRLEERELLAAQHTERLASLLSARRFDQAAQVITAATEGLAGSQGGGMPREQPRIALSAELSPPATPPDLARRILSELVREYRGAVVTGENNDALALVPVPEHEQDSHRAAQQLRAHLRGAVEVLEAGLAERRFALGVSSVVHGIPDLRGAAVEARHARRLAEVRDGQAQVIAGAEIDSHELLLASVPEEVRSSYAERLLGPILAYDAEHRSELVDTLESFLDHSGSWQRCAESLHVHVNTLRYRVGRIEELIGRDLSRLEHRVDVFLALRLRGR
ncbi:PucR family transcriptional regulator ligand-binding domain-containing protein [Lipingzhangella sp. LS1_29]|uniref:PucR family transcriptional regulator ligand-binding domain-containing protein n=1 Tax=Lipingzhangella rawalii TaxID=2055835 RepID=A0ABU2H2B5_9ACTN|nr:PucR family transcriptional regulator ligand-binding domain-containing protein [Lipingzhangella rawalii]MDS1269004.1 PucR family transcriptional regulator ligand-binding domain-containing protein [Lipingzhangella rawalii]